jgi:hypothetical protein
MKKILFLLSLSILFFSCKDDTINEPYDNYILATQLIGTWQNNDYMPEKLVLFNNYTFVDTFYATFNDRPTVLQNHFSFRGTYKIENNLLKFDNVTMTGGKSVGAENVLGFSVELFPQRGINFVDNRLELDFCHILNPLNNYSAEIKGKWESNSLIIAFVKNSNPQLKGGWRKDTYEFIPNRNICIYQYKYLFDMQPSVVNDSTTYKLVDSNLIFENMYIGYRYEFKNNQIILHNFTSHYQKM